MLRFRQKISDDERAVSYSNPKNRVYSYSDITNKRRNNPTENKKTSRRIKLPFFQLLVRWLVVISIVMIISALTFASSSPIVRISSDEVPILPQSDYEQSAITFIKSSLLNHTKLTFDYLGFELNMKEKHPEIASVNTSFALVGSRPVIRLSFYKPVIRVTSLGKTWLVDSRGMAIASSQTDDKKLPAVIDEIGVAKELGDAVISASDVNFILTLENIAKEKGINIDKYTTPAIPKQLDVRVVGEQYYTKFNLDEDSKEQAGAWLVAREKLLSIGQIPAEYLDLRASEKVFWR